MVGEKMAEQRYTRKDAERCFENLANAMNKEAGDCWEKADDKWKAKIGCWQLDYNPIYGGCVVREIFNEAGAVTEPLGTRRFPPREFCDIASMIIRAIEIIKKKVD